MKYIIDNGEMVDQAVEGLRKNYYKSASGLTMTAVLFLFSAVLGKIIMENAPYVSGIAFFATVLAALPYVIGLYLALRYISHRFQWRSYPEMEAKLSGSNHEALHYRRKIRMKLTLLVVLLMSTVALLGCAYLEAVRNQVWKSMEDGDYSAVEELLEYYPVNSYRDNGDMKSLAESLHYRSKREFHWADVYARHVELDGLSVEEQQRLDHYKVVMAVDGEREVQFEIVKRYAEKEAENRLPASSGYSSSHTPHRGHNRDEEESWDGEEYINEDYDNLYDDELFYDERMDD